MALPPLATHYRRPLPKLGRLWAKSLGYQWAAGCSWRVVGYVHVYIYILYKNTYMHTYIHTYNHGIIMILIMIWITKILRYTTWLYHGIIPWYYTMVLYHGIIPWLYLRIMMNIEVFTCQKNHHGKAQDSSSFRRLVELIGWRRHTDSPFHPGSELGFTRWTMGFSHEKWWFSHEKWWFTGI